MAIDKDLNVSPYYDDYDEEKKFHRVLFKPAVPVQARELTQVQSILQNQIPAPFFVLVWFIPTDYHEENLEYLLNILSV